MSDYSRRRESGRTVRRVEGACTRRVIPCVCCVAVIRIRLVRTGATEQCVKCGGTVNKEDGCKFGAKTYHIKCLCCSQCGKPPPSPLCLPLSHPSLPPIINCLLFHCYVVYPPPPPLPPYTYIPHPLHFLSAPLYLCSSLPIFSNFLHIFNPSSLPTSFCSQPLPLSYSCCLTSVMPCARVSLLTRTLMPLPPLL